MCANHVGITYADLWTLAGAVAVEEMGGPFIPWRPGRRDHVDASKVPPNGRLPDAAQGITSADCAPSSYRVCGPHVHMLILHGFFHLQVLSTSAMCSTAWVSMTARSLLWLALTPWAGESVHCPLDIMILFFLLMRNAFGGLTQLPH
jgi:hypothetical protein